MEKLQVIKATAFYGRKNEPLESLEVFIPTHCISLLEKIYGENRYRVYFNPTFKFQFDLNRKVNYIETTISGDNLEIIE